MKPYKQTRLINSDLPTQPHSWLICPEALLIAIMLMTVFQINLQLSPSLQALTLCLYKTYCGLTSCTALPCWGLGLGEGREDGEERGDGNGGRGRGGGWVGLKSPLPSLCR